MASVSPADKRKLAKFLEDSISVIDTVVDRLDQIAPSLRHIQSGDNSDLQKKLREAWTALDQRGDVKTTLRYLNGEDAPFPAYGRNEEPLFNSRLIPEYVTWDYGRFRDGPPSPRWSDSGWIYHDPDQLLIDHGLYGSELDFKLDLYQQHLEIFNKSIEEFDTKAARQSSKESFLKRLVVAILNPLAWMRSRKSANV